MTIQKMAPRERFVAALRREPVDRVPIFDWVNNPALYAHHLQQQPGFYDGRLAVQLVRALGLDAAWAPAGGFLGLPSERWRWPTDHDFVDEWGVGYRVGEGSWPLAFPQIHPVRTVDDWRRVTPPNPAESWRLEHVAAAVAEARRPDQEPVAVVAGIRGPFSSAWMLMGLQEMSYTLLEHPDLLEEIFSVTADFWTAVGLRLIAAGADALVIHDDQGSGTSTFFAPRRFRQHVLPYLRRQVQALRAAGALVILHSCGNVNGILGDLAESGIHALNNIQRSAGMDLAAVKAQHGGRLCLVGNVDASNVMPYASPAEVEQAVRDCLRIAAPGGGYILATDHSFHEGVPVENVHAFIRAGQEHGRYDR